jgi:hypothetical protein
MANASDFELYVLDRDLSREQLIDELAAIPDRVRDVLASCAAAGLLRQGLDGEWRPIEVLRHLRDAVQVYGMRFKWMILNDAPLLPNYDEDRWAADSPDGPDDASAIATEIAAYRAETVRLLRALRDEGWSRIGRHEVLGEVILDPYVRHELAHEEMHLAQLERALANES